MPRFGRPGNACGAEKKPTTSFILTEERADLLHGNVPAASGDCAEYRAESRSGRRPALDPPPVHPDAFEL